jgi:GAF domain-containing protein
MQRLVEDCVALLDAVQAGIMLIDQRGGARVVATTSEDTLLLELLQVHLDRGPGVECLRSGDPVLVRDLGGDAPRWPEFAVKAIEQGFRSVHSLPLRLRTETIGALSLFHVDPGALDPGDVRIAQALADIATIGILQQRTIARGEVLAAQLQTALNSRVAIEQAKGVLAATGDIGLDEAFARLRDYCRPRNLGLTAAAVAIAAGKLPASTVLAG